MNNAARHPLAKARALAVALCYQGEKAEDGLTESSVPSHAAARAAFDGLQATPDLMPEIADVVENSANRLFLPAALVWAYVYPSADLQASCTTLDDETCYVRVSSTLAEAFDDAELAFVIGHEIGHFLLDHSRMSVREQGDLAQFAIMRAREISCDRMGLIACGGVEPAMRAIMKTVTGLSGKRLRFDAAAYLRASLEDNTTTERQYLYATHPPMPVRARALLGFNDIFRSHYPDYEHAKAREAFWRMDDHVARDMERYVKQKYADEITKLKDEARDWIWLGAAVADGRLSAGERVELARHVAEGFVAKAERAFAAMTVTEVHAFVTEKAGDAANGLRKADVHLAKRFLGAELAASENAFLGGRPRNITRSGL